MAHTTEVEATSGRKFYLDRPDDLRADEPVTLILNLHGGGSVGAWQRAYFPAQDYADRYRLVIATPSAATKEPARRWVGEADDAHLRAIVRQVLDQLGPRSVEAFWLVGHSQGGMTSNRLLREDRFFQDRIVGWLSISGGRIGPIELPESFFSPHRARPQLPPGSPRPGQAVMPDCDFSFIFATGEHEMVALPEASPWAEKYGAGPRERCTDIVDTAPGQIHDTRFGAEGGPQSTAAWGLLPRPGTAQMWVYPGAKGGRVIADVVRLDKGHTEGLEPRVTEELITLMVSAPGGKVQQAEAATTKA
jgi:pimeloyl-ACP methyl ester carboxylesterase